MIEKIKIGDKLRPVSFGFASLRYFESESGKSFSEITESITDTLIVVWSGLKDGARRSGEDFVATVDDVADWLDREPTVLQDIMKLYGDSLGNLNSPQTGAGQ